MADAIQNRDAAASQLINRCVPPREAYALLDRSKREFATALFEACSLLNDAGSCDDTDSTLAKMRQLLDAAQDEFKQSRRK